MYPRDRDQLEAFYRGDMSWRRLWVLVSQLPPSSRTVRMGGWSQMEHLLADAVETLAWANYQRGEGKGQKPKPYKRPGQQQQEERKKAKKPMTQAQFDAFLAGG